MCRFTLSYFVARTGGIAQQAGTAEGPTAACAGHQGDEVASLALSDVEEDEDV